MSREAATQIQNSVALLRRMAQLRVAEERCELCSATIVPIHRHLMEIAKRKIICACDPCAMRFQDVIGGRFKLIPRDARILPDFQMTASQWDSFALPINLTFFYRDTQAGRVIAMYPSPAGVTESLLPAKNWEALEAENPVLAGMEPDVEALLVNRIGVARDYFITPIDVCYELAGLIRMNWRGLHGGEEVWREIGNFFARLHERAVSFNAKTAEVCDA
jgi:hypothetical protein